MYDSLVKSAKILIVDDDTSNIALLERILTHAGYLHCKSTADPRGVVALYLEFQPDLLFLDLKMPYLDGFQILDFITPLVGNTAYLPVLVITGDRSLESRKRALASGAKDFLLKPFDAEEVCLRVRNLLQARFLHLQLQSENRALEERVRERTQELEEYQLDLKESQLEIIVRLARAAELRDDDTGHHTQRVGLTSSLLAQSLGLTEDQVELIRRAAPLHDVGKIAIPDAILLKPGALTPDEREVMKTHCIMGAEVLSGGHSELVKTAEVIALSHHERYDGIGYPHKMGARNIPIEGRILAVADVFDALTHKRPYKGAWSIDAAVAEISNQRGRQFDPEVVDAFLGLPHEKLI